MHLLVLLGISFILNVSLERNSTTEEITNVQRMTGKAAWKMHVLGLSVLSAQVQFHLSLKAGG